MLLRLAQFHHKKNHILEFYQSVRPLCLTENIETLHKEISLLSQKNIHQMNYFHKLQVLFYREDLDLVRLQSIFSYQLQIKILHFLEYVGKVSRRECLPFQLRIATNAQILTQIQSEDSYQNDEYPNTTTCLSLGYLVR